MWKKMRKEKVKEIMDQKVGYRSVFKRGSAVG